MPHNKEGRNEAQAGQSHLNSDAKIGHEGRPQGAPLPIVFSRRYGLGRAPTRGAPTTMIRVMPWGGRPLGVPLPIVFSRRYALGSPGAHKGHPYRLSGRMAFFQRSLGVMPWEQKTRGAHQFYKVAGAPHCGEYRLLPICAVRAVILGVMPWEGRPQGARPIAIRFGGWLPWGSCTEKECRLLLGAH